MPLTPDLKTSYEAVLGDLELERNEILQQVSALQARLKELHHSIATLNRRISPDAPSSSSSLSSTAPSNRYAFMSTRWAILDLLADSQPKTTAEIAAALQAAGIQTRAAVFANNVSSVLSTTMKEQHKEVRPLPDGKWELTENGKSAIEHIRTTGRFQACLHGRGFARSRRGGERE
jgi:hypothetical protein